MLTDFVAFDVEMPSQHSMRISAIGITVVKNSKIEKSIYSLINPEVEFDPFIVKLIGITEQMVKDKPTFGEFWPQIEQVMSSSLLVAHGAACDLIALCATLRHYGIKWFDKVRYACTCDLGIICYPELEKYNLDALCHHIGFERLNHHNAASDSEGCARLMLDYIQKGVDVESHLCTFDVKHLHKVHNAKSRKLASKGSLEQKIRSALFAQADEKIKRKKEKQNPSLAPETIIGVHEDRICSLASAIVKSNRSADFIASAEHKYLEENDLHARLISYKNKYSSCIKLIDDFLPFIESVETCDMLRPRIFKSRQPELIDQIFTWSEQENVFSKILAINFIMSYFFSREYICQWLELVSSLESDNPALNEKRASLIAKSLLKFPEETLPFFEEKAFDKWTHNMALQIAAFSKNVSKEKREFFVSMRI